MPGAKELKDRIKAVQETRKITNAMYLISSTRLRRAKVDYAETQPYFDALRAEIGRILGAAGGYESRYLCDGGAPNASGACGVLVFTSDKGLAGAYNVNVLREAEALLREKPDARVFVVGDCGRRYFALHGRQATFLSAAQSPTEDSARRLAAPLLDAYDSGELNELVVLYTDMKNSLVSLPVSQRLLPLPRAALGAEAERLELVPSAGAVVDAVVRSYIGGFLYAAALGSYCAEQNARVAAMDAANGNAQELLDALSLQLNRTRQGAITREITEISAGAQAQRNANRKKGGAQA